MLNISTGVYSSTSCTLIALKVKNNTGKLSSIGTNLLTYKL